MSEKNMVSEDTLSFLARNDDDSVRKAVAGNKNLTADILALLAKDKDHLIRMAALSNRNTPVDTLASLISDKDPHVFVRKSHTTRTRVLRFSIYW